MLAEETFVNFAGSSVVLLKAALEWPPAKVVSPSLGQA
jgi:hypothetical protein